MRPNQKDFGKTWILATSFIVAGYSCGPGVLHLTYYMPKDDIQTIHFDQFLIGGTIYAGGAVIYSLKFPEKWFPGWFDYIGNSHNIFHVCVVIGALMHWRENDKMFHER